jgi:hypothetical protein
LYDSSDVYKVPPSARDHASACPIISAAHAPFRTGLALLPFEPLPPLRLEILALAMAPIIHEIAPDYDTVIVLKYPCTDFAPWDQYAETLGAADQVPSEKSAPESPSSKLYLDSFSNTADDGMSSVNTEIEVHEGATLSNRDDETVNRSPFFGLGTEREPADADQASPSIEPSDPDEQVVHYHVTRSHLIQASPWFKRTLTGSRWEETRSSTDGLYYILASDWDEEAFLILLNIFHLRKRQVPKTVDLEMLAKIAVLVDYYELGGTEAIEDDIYRWIDAVRRDCAIPKAYGRDLVLWMCVSFVLDMQDEFNKATEVAMRESNGCIRTLGLPIHLLVTGMGHTPFRVI